MGRRVASATVTAVSVIKQIPSVSGVPDPTLRIRLCMPDGSVIAERTYLLEDTVYTRLYVVDTDVVLPEDLPPGAYLAVDLTKSGGAPLATGYRIYRSE